MKKINARIIKYKTIQTIHTLLENNAVDIKHLLQQIEIDDCAV